MATGDRCSLLRLLAGVSSELGVPARPVFEPSRAGDVRHSLADIGAARRLLRYRPVCDFETGLRDTVAWYRSQQG